MTRSPIVAGMFYDARSDSLLADVSNCFLSPLGPGELPACPEDRMGRVVGLVCPHAGYVYSGPAAAWSYKALGDDGLPDVAVLIGPNHSGVGAAVSVADHDEWATPLGVMKVDRETAMAVVTKSAYAQFDTLAHSREHSIEVQLPFLQFLEQRGGRTSIVPIALKWFRPEDAKVLAKDLGSAIAGAVAGRSAVVIASTDFTHYESAESARSKDSKALERISALDADGLIDVVDADSISMCGVMCAAVAIQACRELGATRCEKLAYYTSGDVTGDMGEVVGYGAAAMLR